MKRIQVIDSHTGGEPTRIIVGGGPDLGKGPFGERVERFRNKFDEIRSAVVNEPRGTDVLIGGLLCEPTDPKYLAGIIFFNTASYLGMCGHGTIGLMVTLQYMGKAEPGTHLIETPVGDVQAELHDSGSVTVRNVPAYRLHANVEVEIADYGTVIGDVAWGGNWFFLIKNSMEDLHVQHADHLIQVTKQIRSSLAEKGITGGEGAYIDHVELFGPPVDSGNHSKNFVLCPGGSYDRSPCGTGMSAKLACLAADGKLAPGETWRQESIVGSVFTCSYAIAKDGKIIPTICGSAHISGEGTLILDPSDPFCTGIKF